MMMMNSKLKTISASKYDWRLCIRRLYFQHLMMNL
jgi:hypothetical protein